MFPLNYWKNLNRNNNDLYLKILRRKGNLSNLKATHNYSIQEIPTEFITLYINTKF